DRSGAGGERGPRGRDRASGRSGRRAGGPGRVDPGPREGGAPPVSRGSRRDAGVAGSHRRGPRRLGQGTRVGPERLRASVPRSSVVVGLNGGAPATSPVPTPSAQPARQGSLTLTPEVAGRVPISGGPDRARRDTI